MITAVKESPIPMALVTEVVTASTEHIPRSWTNTGLFVKSPSFICPKKVGFEFIKGNRLSSKISGSAGGDGFQRKEEIPFCCDPAEVKRHIQGSVYSLDHRFGADGGTGDGVHILADHKGILAGKL